MGNLVLLSDSSQEIRSSGALGGWLVCWRAAAVQSASTMPCRIAGHSGSCTALRSLANPLLGWWWRRGGGGEHDYYCSQNKPASDYKLKSSGGKNVSNKTARSAVSTGDWGAEAGDGGSGRFSSPVASDRASRSLCLSHPHSLLFRSVNVRSRSLVSGNDLTQQTESSGRAEPRKEKRRRGEEERHRLHLAAPALAPLLLQPSFHSHGLLLWDHSLMQSREATSAIRLVVLTESPICGQTDVFCFFLTHECIPNFYTVCQWSSCFNMHIFWRKV